MATAFTHGFVSCFIAPFAPQNLPRSVLFPTLMFLAAAPDLDIIGFQLGIPYTHPLGHRGLTHSLPFAVLAGIVMACTFHRYVGLFSIRWLKLAFLFAIATASHGFLDAFTDSGYGIGFFIPFDNSRYFFPWRPLKTSPIGITSFFNGNALAIMKNEIIWVWLPVLILGGITWIVRRSTRAA